MMTKASRDPYTDGRGRRRRRGGCGRRAAGALAAGLVASGCASGRPAEPGAPGPAPKRVYAHAASYRVSCSVSDECRVTYIDETGELRARDVVGEWTMDLGADPGARLWLRAGAGGCPPRPVRVEIVVDGASVSEQLARPPGSARCEWILAETEFRLP